MLAKILCAVALAATTASAAELSPWRHGTFDPKSDAGILFMAGEGFAEREGLQLEFVEFHNDVVEVQALLSGAIDSYEGSPGSAILAASRGADVKAVGCGWPILPHALFVRSEIAKVEDLKGRTIATSLPGSLPSIFAATVLKQRGLGAGEVQWVNLGNDPDRYKSVVAGVAQATVVSREFDPVAAGDGVKLLVGAEAAMPRDLRLCTLMTGRTLATRGDDAARFLAAEMRATRYALAHREEALALTRKRAKLPPANPRPAYIYDWAVAAHAVDPEFSLPEDKLAHMEEELVDLGNIPKPFDIRTMIAPEPRRKALALVEN